MKEDNLMQTISPALQERLLGVRRDVYNIQRFNTEFHQNLKMHFKRIQIVTYQHTEPST